MKEGRILGVSGITEYIYWFMGLNLIVVISCLPLAFALLTLQLHPGNSFYFLIALLPLGASLQSLYACFEKIKKFQDIYLIKDYFAAYKTNFRKSTLLWGLTLLILYILLLNLNFLMDTPFFALLFPAYAILAISLLSSLNISLVLIATGKKMAIKTLFTTSFYLSMKRIPLSLLNVFLIFLWLFIIFIRPVLGLGILSSIFAFMMMKNSELIVNQRREVQG